MSDRRGLVILAVLVIVVAAALIATSAVVKAGAERRSTEAATRRAESEALAWSGVQLTLDELRSQRDDLLRGDTPELTKTWTLYTTPFGERAVVRLVPDADGVVAAPEAGRLDLNTASADSLAALPGLDEASARAIVAARPFQSVRDLANVPDVNLDPRELAGEGTVYTYEPAVQAGVFDDARTGRKRLNLSAEWSGELAAAIDEQWGRGVSDAVKGLRDAGATFTTYADYIRVLTNAQVQRSEWGGIFDAVCLSDDPFEGGRVDMLRAPEAVLASVPGLDADSAASIVGTRERLSDTERRTLTWPITQGILEPSEWAEAAPHLTMRSMQWRVRVEAGFMPAAGDSESAAALRDAYDAEETTLTDRVVFEAVLDAGGKTARVAYLRDATLEEAWASVLADGANTRTPTDGDVEEEEPASEPELALDAMPLPAAAPPPPADPAPASADANTGAGDPRVGRWRAIGGAS